MPPEDNEPVVNPTPNDLTNPANQPDDSDDPATAHTPAAANAIVNATPPNGNQVGVFVAPQSFLTFSGSTAAVTMISNVLVGVGAINANNKGWLMLIISFAVGLIIYIATVSSDGTWRQKVLDAAVAIINTFTIAAAVLGVDVITTGGNSNSSPGAPNNKTNTNTSTRNFYKKPLSDGREVSIVYREDEKPKLTIQ